MARTERETKQSTAYDLRAAPRTTKAFCPLNDDKEQRPELTLWPSWCYGTVIYALTFTGVYFLRLSTTWTCTSSGGQLTAGDVTSD